MPAVLDMTRPGAISGHGAKQIWAHGQQQPTVTEGSTYFVEEREARWRLERVDGGFVASDLATGIFGYGERPNEAIVDLVHALREHREVLERQAELSPDLAEQLAYLKRT
jgi:hypothetical protein